MLEASLRAARGGWDDELAELEPELAALVDLVAYGGFVAAAAVVYPDETRLVRALLGDAAPPKGSDEARALLPVVLRLLDPPVGRLADGVGLGRAAPRRSRGAGRSRGWHRSTACSASTPSDRSIGTCSGPGRWPGRSPRTCSADWGATRDDVEVAASHLDRLAALGPLAPPPGPPQ